ncbi:MAG TPA: molybdopterin-dependent oxidoreductase, partial [Thermoanaerobaculia bacterium]|nr:molybdopterin-dependent oxidoreductase [Thermoanaerobaculia bacterium]
SRAVAILAALLGSWGRKGGYLLPTAMELPKVPTPKTAVNGDAVDRANPGLYPFSDEVLASGLCDATMPGLPERVHGWMVYGTNLLQALPDQARTIRAIEALDFLVTVDVLPMEIVGWSDVVLPESTYLERFDDLWSPAYREPFVAVRQPAVAPMYDSRPGWWIAKELATRLGVADQFPWKDPVENAAMRMQMAGLDFDELLRRGVITIDPPPSTEEEGVALGFDTPSGKIELASEQLAASGFDPIPVYTPHDPPPPGMFRLLSGRAPVHTFGRTVNNPVLSEAMAENEVWVNAAVAGSLPAFDGMPLRSGDYVVLENQDGVRSGRVRAKVTERIRGDAVYLVHGFGHAARRLSRANGRGASDSVLTTRFARDPIMGGTGMNVNFVRILPAEVA